MKIRLLLAAVVTGSALAALPPPPKAGMMSRVRASGTVTRMPSNANISTEWRLFQGTDVTIGGPQTQIGVGSHWALFHEPSNLTMTTGKPLAC